MSRTQSTSETIGKLGTVLQLNPDTATVQSCLVPILSEIALSLALIADMLAEEEEECSPGC